MNTRRPSRIGGSSRLEREPGRICVVGCLRNERVRLPSFLAHYRRLGASSFLLVDNGSDDGSLELLEEQDDVVLYTTEASYAASRFGLDWTTEVANRHAVGRWVLTVDIDELIVYPHCEELDLPRLTSHLERRRATGLLGFLLDMYSHRPIAETVLGEGEDLLDVCPYHDADTYSSPRRGPLARVPNRGGPRQRLFWDGRNLPHPPPFLAKTPLLLWPGGDPYAVSTHQVRARVRYEGTTCALLHFKFLADFPRAALEEVRRGEHFAGARQYHAYASRFLEEPALSAYFERSRRYRGSRGLLDEGLLRADRKLPR
ncbi:MAG: glycosyltransferase family 2 protein [Acidobacteria bacterium]|nr:MAG: glycosyltransferase family 2 protein [Acidobacteriota bacterium]